VAGCRECSNEPSGSELVRQMDTTVSNQLLFALEICNWSGKGSPKTNN
jgi:hypothetical protein